jgi:hypothetical protein
MMGMRTQMAGTCLAVVGMLGCGACTLYATNPVSAAQQMFARETYCPDGRVDARLRADLEPASGTPTNRFRLPSPPVDVAADPERLALWQAQTGEWERRRYYEEEDTIRETRASTVVVEVDGCDAHSLYICVWTKRRHGRGCFETKAVRPRVTLGTGIPPAHGL